MELSVSRPLLVQDCVKLNKQNAGGGPSIGSLCVYQVIELQLKVPVEKGRK